MAFSSGSTRNDGSIAEINIIPLCDVLLVLLIIFMVTAPMPSHSIDFDLPQPIPDRPLVLPDPIHLRIDAAGQAYWNEEAVGLEQLRQRMSTTAAVDVADQPMLQIDASGDCDYQVVARVAAMAKNAKLARVGFVRR
ncbi:MAG: biopolymer transporter ExbD [Luteimonas sp.]|nr:biopolymer transporter ExbD [Luteimonas sp.]